MEQIRDKALLERLMEEKGIGGFLFILEGSVRVYGLREDGGDYSVAQGAEQDMLGMMEFVRENQPALYTEALEDTLCIALPIEKNRAVLEKDSLFLRRLLEYSVRLVMLSAMAGRPGQRLAEKVVAFLRDIQPDHTLHSINAGLLQFRCSRRQLQRVVRKLCEDGVLKKVGKGKYQLR